MPVDAGQRRAFRRANVTDLAKAIRYGIRAREESITIVLPRREAIACFEWIELRWFSVPRAIVTAWVKMLVTGFTVLITASTAALLLWSDTPRSVAGLHEYFYLFGSLSLGAAATCFAMWATILRVLSRIDRQERDEAEIEEYDA